MHMCVGDARSTHAHKLIACSRTQTHIVRSVTFKLTKQHAAPALLTNKTRKNNLIKHGNEEYFSTKKFKQQREKTLVKKYYLKKNLI